MVVRISDKTQNYSKVTKLLVKPNDKSIYVSHLLETLAQSAGAEVVKKAVLLAEGNEWIDSFRRFL